MSQSSTLCVRQENGRYRPASESEIMTAAACLSWAKARGSDFLTAPAATEDFLRTRLGGEKREVFAAIYCDNRHRVLDWEPLFYGTIDGSSVHPRVVVQRVLETNAAAVVFAHNHPSGIAEPSQADLRITQRLKDALALIEVRVLDHMIIGEGPACSLAARGLL